MRLIKEEKWLGNNPGLLHLKITSGNETISIPNVRPLTSIAELQTIVQAEMKRPGTLSLPNLKFLKSGWTLAKYNITDNSEFLFD